MRSSSRSPRIFSLRISASTLNKIRCGMMCPLLLAGISFAMQSSAQTPASTPDSQRDKQNAVESANHAPSATAVTIPAGTNIALVLTHPIQSRYIHRGDDIYAQIISPVTSGNEVVIPAGILVQAKVEKLGRHGDRGELYLQSMAIDFPDGYVAPVGGPIKMESDQGYALKDPGNGRTAAFFLGPIAGTAVGALIGHSVGSEGTTVVSNVCDPSGCATPIVTPSTKGRDTVIGAAIGGGAGLAAGLLIANSSHHFFLDVGAPVEMVLQHSLTLQQDEVAAAVNESEQHPASQQPVAQRPALPPPPPNTNTGTCWTPGTPGTPDIDIPGTPPIGDSPGTPPIHIPGTPGTPATPHPCP
jgi:hypothetical protein